MSAEFVLETRGLTKEFKGFVAVNQVDLKVQRGAIIADGPYAEVAKNPLVIEAYMGTTNTELQGAH